MPICKIELSQTVYEKLVAVALHEWRPTQWQAEVLLRDAILLESSKLADQRLASSTDAGAQARE
jgi:hypothetical protein